MMENHTKRRRRWREWSVPVRVLFVLAGIILVCGIITLSGFVVMWLWNWLMPVIFSLPTIGFWQALGLMALTTILFRRPHSVGQASRERRRKRAFRDRLRTTSEDPDDGPPDNPAEEGTT